MEGEIEKKITKSTIQFFVLEGLCEHYHVQISLVTPSKLVKPWEQTVCESRLGSASHRVKSFRDFREWAYSALYAEGNEGDVQLGTENGLRGRWIKEHVKLGVFIGGNGENVPFICKSPIYVPSNNVDILEEMFQKTYLR